MNPSVLLYVQHLLGIGHLERALRLARALSREGMRVTLVCGGKGLASREKIAAERVVQLPPIKAGDSSFRTLIDGRGERVGEALCAERRTALLAAYRQARPEALILESFPFGRRAFRFELDPLIAAARAQNPRPLLFSSIRDILVAPQSEEKSREITARVREEFDAVLVHADPSLVTLERSFPAAREIADRLYYTGYIGREELPPNSPLGAGEVVVSAGGGAVGGPLLRAALEARRKGCLSGVPWRLFAGANLPLEEYAALQPGLQKGVVLERHREDFADRLFACRVSVSQAGYNTMLDILAARARAVVVPFASGREIEQTLRAEIFASLGLVEVVAEKDLTPERLGAAIARAALRPQMDLAIATDGALKSAEIVARMLALRSRQFRSAASEAIMPQ